MKRSRFFNGPSPPRLAVERGAGPVRVVGVDWSGAKLAGKAIWLAEGLLSSGGADEECGCVLTLNSVCCAASLPGGQPERAAAVAAVRERLEGATPVWVGLDAPVGLSIELMRAACDGARDNAVWRGFIDGYRWTEADDMRAWARATAGGEPKRRCDRAAKAPFAPTNLRLYRQTHSALSLLLRPMIRAGQLSVVPNSLDRDATADAAAAALLPVRLLETCPASLLKRVGLYDRPYKAASAEARAARARILDALCGADGIASGHAGGSRVRLALADDGAAAPLLREAILRDAGGDALDSVLAAAIAALAVSSGQLPRPPEGWAEEYWEEGCIYY